MTSRFGAAAKGLRGPFQRLVQKLRLTARRVLIKRGAPGPTPSHRHRVGRETRLLNDANTALDRELLRLTQVPRRQRPRTVVAAYNVRTGQVAVGHSSQIRQECAEGAVVRQLGGRASDIRFTVARRPNASGPPYRAIPVCAQYCEPEYGRSAFPDPATLFASDAS